MFINMDLFKSYFISDKNININDFEIINEIHTKKLVFEPYVKTYTSQKYVEQKKDTNNYIIKTNNKNTYASTY